MQVGDEHLRSQPVQVPMTRLSCPGSSPCLLCTSSRSCKAQPRGIPLELVLTGLWSLGRGEVLTQHAGLGGTCWVLSSTFSPCSIPARSVVSSPVKPRFTETHRGEAIFRRSLAGLCLRAQ